MSERKRITYRMPWSSELMSKYRTIFYYASESEKAKQLAIQERVHRKVGLTRDANVFHGSDAEDVDAVVIMPDVPAHHRRKIHDAYGRKVVTEPRESAGDDHEQPTMQFATTQAIGGVAHRDTEDTSAINEPVRVTPDDLSVMTGKELRAYAAQIGVTLNHKLRKRGEIIAAIQAGA